MRSDYDPTLFAGTATYYSRHRPGYPAALIHHLTECFNLDGSGCALDLGCGTGQLTVALSPCFARVIGMDPDPEMLVEALRTAATAGASNIEFVQGSSWDLPALQSAFRLVTIAEAFHWMEREEVLKLIYDRVLPGGGIAIVSRKYHPPDGWQEVVDQAVRKFIGEQRRAGQGFYEHPKMRHEVVLGRSQFRSAAPWSCEMQLNWTIDDVLGFLYSTSYASRRLLGSNQEAFEQELRMGLNRFEPRGVLAIRVVITALLGFK